MLATCRRFLQLQKVVTSTSKTAKRKIAMSYTPVETGSEYTTDYRVYFRGPNGEVVSPFHDIPLYANKEKTALNMIVEVPRWSNAKMEISKSDRLNPIKQDLKKGRLRYVHNCFPHHGYIFNYGALPQTWEDPKYRDESTGCLGDNDPLDVCEIGYRVCKRGDVRQVKILGLMALIDEGETDWKIIAIDVSDPQAGSLNDIGDIEMNMPGLLKAIREWFRIYKMPAGSPPNKFAFGGQARDKAFAESVIRETSDHWQEMITGKIKAEGLSLANTTVQDSPFKISKEEAESVIASADRYGPPCPIEPDVDKWHYVDRETVQAAKDD